jgi:hypothetical protein
MLNIARIDEEHLPRETDLVTTIELWIAANDAKTKRIKELEAECNELRGRVARLGRLARGGLSRGGSPRCGRRRPRSPA